MIKHRPKPRVLKPVEEDDNANHIQKLNGRFAGEDIFICGSGTSLHGFNWERLKGKITIALNDALKAPGLEATIHLFSDQNLYKAKKPDARPSGGYNKYEYPPDTLIICQRAVRCNFLREPGRSVEFKRRIYQFNILNEPAPMKFNDDHLFISRTVATGAICLAWKLGAKRIFLLGIDGYKLRFKDKKEMYYHDGSVKPKEKRKESAKAMQGFDMVVQDRHELWQKQMTQMKRYFEAHGNPYPSLWPAEGIYNLSKLSTISAWEKIPPDAVL